MQRQSIIVFIQGERIETYGNLKKLWELTTISELDKRGVIREIKDKLVALKK